MKVIANGYSEDKTFLSDNLTSLLEYCLNYKKNVYFFIDAIHTYYNVKVEYEEGCSKGRYNEGYYECYLNVTFSHINDEQLYYDILFVNSDDWPISDAVKSFEFNYLLNDFLDKTFKKQ